MSGEGFGHLPAGADPAQGVNRYRTPVPLARALQVAFAVWVVFLGAAAGASAARHSLWSGSLSFTAAEASSSDNLALVFAAAWTAFYLATGVLFIAWTHRVYRNLHPLGARGLRNADGWAIGSWFVPFLNAVRPKVMIDDAWRGSVPDASVRPNLWYRGTDPLEPIVAPVLENRPPAAETVRAAVLRRDTIPLVMSLWWGAFLIASLGTVVIWIPDNGGVEITRSLAMSRAGFATLGVVAAALAFRVVGLLTARQEARARLVGVGPARVAAEGDDAFGRLPAGAGSGAPPQGLAHRPVLLAGLSVVVALTAFGMAFRASEVASPVSGAEAEPEPLFAEGESIFGLEGLFEGDCFDSLAGGSQVREVPCSGKHRAEVFAVVELDDPRGTPYPGENEVHERGLELCYPAFEPYVGGGSWRAGLDVFVLYPLSPGWALGDRMIQCVVTPLDGTPVDGSIRRTGGLDSPGSQLNGYWAEGDCLDEPGAEVRVTPLVPCDSPHDWEVFAVADHPAASGVPLPSLADLDAFALAECSEWFESFVGAPLGRTDLNIIWSYPEELVWSTGDRSFSCILVHYRGDRLHRSMEGTGSTSDGQGSFAEWRAGECFDDPEDWSRGITIISCDEPHDNEVFAILEHPAGPGAPYPVPEDPVAWDVCSEGFVTYVGAPPTETTLTLFPWLPEAGPWEEGDRSMLCVLYDAALGKLTGTMQDTGPSAGA